MSKKHRNRQLERPVEAESVREEVQAEQAPAIPKLDFDAWFAIRGKAIPKHHHKEIIKADFKARGLGQEETIADFDEALRKYGVKLS